MIYDLIIIGGGPAGVAAGIYAARKKIKTVFITDSFVNQSSVSDNIQNWIGTVSISGAKLTENLEKHLRAYAGDTVDIKVGEHALDLKKSNDNIFTVNSEDQAKNILDKVNNNCIYIQAGSEFQDPSD